MVSEKSLTDSYCESCETLVGPKLQLRIESLCLMVLMLSLCYGALKRQETSPAIGKSQRAEESKMTKPLQSTCTSPAAKSSPASANSS